MDEKYNCMPWLFFFLLLLQVNKTHHSEDEMPQVSFFTGRNKASSSTVDLPSSSSAQSSTKETTWNSISGAEEKVTLSLDTPPCEQRAQVNPGEWFFVVAIAAINCNNKTLKPACFLLNLALEIHKFWKHTRHLYLTRENCTPYWCNFFFLHFPQLRLRSMIYNQIAQLKDLFDKEIITRDQFDKERAKLVNELNKID